MTMQEQLTAIAEAIGKEAAMAISTVREELGKTIADLSEKLELAIRENKTLSEELANVQKRLESVKDYSDDITQMRQSIEDAHKSAESAVADAKSLIEGLDMPEQKEIDTEALESSLREQLDSSITEGLKIATESLDSRFKSLQDSLVIPEAEVHHGVDGKDALQLEVLPTIDFEKSYPRGTYATHNGGLFRAYQKTTGSNGWECIVNGVASFTISESGKGVKISAVMADGTLSTHDVLIPTPEYKGVFNQDAEYERGDFVTSDGSVWVLVKDHSEEAPGKGDSWKLAVKRGERGHGIYALAKKNGFKGTEQELFNHIIKGEKPDTVVRL